MLQSERPYQNRDHPPLFLEWNEYDRNRYWIPARAGRRDAPGRATLEVGTILQYLICSIVVSWWRILGARAGLRVVGDDSPVELPCSLALFAACTSDELASGWWAVGGCVPVAAALIILIGALLMGARRSAPMMTGVLFHRLWVMDAVFVGQQDGRPTVMEPIRWKLRPTSDI